MAATPFLARDTHAHPRGRFVSFLVPAMVGMVPLGLLVWLWGGHLTSSNPLRAASLSAGVRFDSHALSLYLAVPAVYLAPLVFPRVRRAGRAAWAAGLAAGLFVLALPVEPSIVQTQDGVFTVGFVHRAIHALVGAPVERMLFAAFAVVNLTAIASAFRRATAAWRAGRVDEAEIFLWLGVAAFLAVMPFSYMPWEKVRAAAVDDGGSAALGYDWAASSTANPPSSVRTIPYRCPREQPISTPVGSAEIRVTIIRSPHPVARQ